jgi:Sulfotransferase family
MLEPYERIANNELSFDGAQAAKVADPIAIGAVGGSGTRAMAAILEAAGVAMASPLNRAGDAMEWPPMRKLLTPAAIERHSRERLMHNILYGFESLLDLRRGTLGLNGRVCWKVPGTFLWLEDFASYFPGIQYIHMIRHGLDMAYSDNQNQAYNWSSRFDIEVELLQNGRVAPGSVLEYWLRANEYATQTGERLLGDRLLVVRFEELCQSPAREIQRILAALQLQVSESALEELAATIAPPSSLGRYRQFDWKRDFSSDQLQRLEALGFSV